MVDIKIIASIIARSDIILSSNTVYDKNKKNYTLTIKKKSKEKGIPVHVKVCTNGLNFKPNWATLASISL